MPRSAHKTGEEIGAIIPAAIRRRVGFLSGRLQGWLAHVKASDTSKLSRVADLEPPKPD